MVPNAEMATGIARQAMGWPAASAERFTTGSAHYVYEVTGTGGEPIVVRMGRAENRVGLRRGLVVQQRLTELGVKLPAILVDGTEADLPFVVMERLEGTDLGHVVDGLSEDRLRGIAGAVADAQARTAGFGSAGRFGYSPAAETAPHGSWADVVEASISRSRRWLAEAGLFGSEWADRVFALFERHRPALERTAATPFLHDTTTKNVIVAPNGRFSGIVDVDDLCFGDPRYAPALTRAALLLHRGPAAYADYWMAAAGHADDAVYRFYVVAFVLDLMSEHGQRFNGNEVPSDPAVRQWLCEIFETEWIRAVSTFPGSAPT